MENAKENRRQKETYSTENAIDALFVKLDEAIDDIENGRVITGDEMWTKLEKI